MGKTSERKLSIFIESALMNAIEFFLVSLLHIAKRNEVYLLVSADERYWVFFLEHPWSRVIDA